MGQGYQPIENYGIIGNLRTAALVSMDGSIDWLCTPYFDSPSVFAAILDDQKGGRFRISPAFEDFRPEGSREPTTVNGFASSQREEHQQPNSLSRIASDNRLAIDPHVEGPKQVQAQTHLPSPSIIVPIIGEQNCALVTLFACIQ